MEQVITISAPMLQILALCRGKEVHLITDFLKLYPSTIGLEPKGHNVTLSGERASLPHAHPILPELMGSIAGPREPQVESPWRAVACWGQGIGPGQGSRHEQTHSLL